MPTILFSDMNKLQETLRAYAANRETFTVALPSERIMSQEITLNVDLTDNDIIGFLNASAEKIFGNAAAALALDYQIKKTIDDKKHIILAIAAHQSLITEIEACFKKAKIPLATITTNPAININLLPWRETSIQKRKRIRNRYSVLYATLSALLFMLLNYGLTEKIKLIQKSTAEILTRNKTITAPDAKANIILLKKLQSLTAKKTDSVNKNKMVLTLLSVIASNLPDSLTLNALSWDNKKTIISGSGNPLDDIHQYNTLLQYNSPWKNVQLTEVHNNTSAAALHFTITMQPTG